jgi:AraC-like DNA-binding protein
VRHGDLIFHWGEDDKVSRLGEGFTYQAIELPAQEAPENSALKDPSFHSCSNGAFLAKGPDIVLELGQYVSAAGAMADSADPLFCPESFSNAFSAHCWGVVERFCWREQGRSEYLTLPHRVRIFKAAKDLIHREEPPLNVSELARGVGVSERTLSHCFRTTVGQSPRTFLRAYRLNKTRDYIIRRADQEENVVTAAAMRYGFWHLGRFSAYYRTQFGEYPSATAEAHSGRPAAERSCQGDGQSMPPRMPERLIYT